MTQETTQPHITGEFRARQNYTDAERNAMRAFLQRCEVRISTQHRIATGFLGGAGLLLLIPIFFRDIVDGILIIVLNTIGNYFSTLGQVNGWFASLVLFALLIYPFFLSLAVPLYGVYLLLKDIVHFYYSLYTPGLPETVLNPSFSLNGLMFSPDESLNVKRDVILYQYQGHRSRYLLPFSENRRGLYFDKILKETDGQIIPRYRQAENLEVIHALRADIDKTHAQRMGAAFGIARSIDRMLVEEVAVTEMLIARNNIYLRRLLLRYVKTLGAFLWTTLLSFLMLPFLNDSRFPTPLVLAVSYLVWALGMLPVVKTPIGWIYRHRVNDDEDGLDVRNRHVDAQLTRLEDNIRWFVYLAIASSALAVVLSIGATVL